MKILPRILSFLLAFLLMALPCLAENPPMAGRRPLAPKADPLYARSISLSPRAKTLYWSESNPVTYQLTVGTRPFSPPRLAEGGNPVIWESENENVATVDQNGNVTPVGMGTTRIRASVQARTRTLRVSCRIRVRGIPVRSITITPNHLDLDLSNKLRNSSAQLTANVLPKNASCTRVTWSSSDENVATVDRITGLVKARSKGNCEVTATDAITKKKTAFVQVCCIDGDDLVPVVFTAGGDLVLGGDKKKKTDRRFADFVQGNWDYVLYNLRDLLRNDDFSIFNLEGPLAGGGTPRKPSRKFNFYGKPEYAKILTAGSVEVANVVNNHAHDYGTKPQTLRALNNEKVKISDERIKSEDNIITIRKDGKSVRVGFIGFFGPVSSSYISSRIRQARLNTSLPIDMLVVSFHFCDAREHSHVVYGSQIRQARAAVDAGAAVVLGHHTHVPSGIEVYKGVYIYYGLGSTQSSGKDFGLRDIYNTFLARQTIWCDPDIDFTLCDVPTLYPICPTGPLEKEGKKVNNCQPIFLQRGDPRFDYVLEEVIKKYSRGKLKEGVDFVYKAHPQ